MSLSAAIKALSGSQTRYVRYVGTAGELVNAAVINIFQIVGGDIRVNAFYGVCMADSDGSATTLQPRIIPTGGAQQVLALACTTLAAATINDTLAPTGAVGVAMVIETTMGVTAGNMGTNEWILLPGIVNILVGGATDALQFYDWVMGYVPLAPGANVVAL